MSYTNIKCFGPHGDTVHSRMIENSGALSTRKGNWVTSSQSHLSASIFSSQSAIEHMKKHLGRKEKPVWYIKIEHYYPAGLNEYLMWHCPASSAEPPVWRCSRWAPGRGRSSAGGNRWEARGLQPGGAWQNIQTNHKTLDLLSRFIFLHQYI